MKTLEDIKQLLLDQDLLNRCTVETSANYEEFSKYVSPVEIDKRIQVLNDVSSTKQFGTYYIVYDSQLDEFGLNNILATKRNGSLTYVEQGVKIIRWVKESENRYILTYDPPSHVGHHFSFKLPYIIKNS